MIILNLKGGLGNQMFQYAAAKLLARGMSRGLKIYQSGLNPVRKGVTKRAYCLDLYKIQEEEQLKIYNNKILFKLQYPVAKLLKHTLVLREVDWNNIEYYKKFRRVILDGYFFDLKAIEANRDVLNSIFVFNDNILDNNSNSILKTIENGHSVALHIRRGDYLNAKNSQIYQSCSREYYLEAISFVKSRINNPLFFIFSDDLAWVKQNLKLEANFSYVDIKSEKKDVTEFLLMSQCKHAIIANSTFSWWASFLRSCPGKIVVAPRSWYKDIEMDKRSRELMPANWTLL